MGAQRNAYIYGTAVRKPEYTPYRREQVRSRRPAGRQVRRHRRKAGRVGAGYTLFLLAAAMIILLVCVSYIKMQVGVAGEKEKIGDLQSTLTTMKDENETHYNAIMDSVDLDEIKERAANDLGMSSADTDQVVAVESGGDEYMQQYGESANASGSDTIASGNN